MQVAAQHVLSPSPPVGSQQTNRRRRLERVVQQSVAMQVQQPLALLHIALTPWQVLRVLRIDQLDLETPFFQNLVERNPIHASGLHGLRLDFTIFSYARRCRSALKHSTGVPAPDLGLDRTLRSEPHCRHRAPPHADELPLGPGPPIAFRFAHSFRSLRFRHNFFPVVILVQNGITFGPVTVG